MSIIIAIIILGLLVMIHESGHFLFAKLVGANVERFSIGMGPVLFSFNYKGTEFAISLIPLGGYVKISGMETDKESYSEGDFFFLPIWKRMLIVIAGPMFNLLLAFLIFFSVFFGVGESRLPTLKVDKLQGYFERGDSILLFDNNKIVYIDEIYNFYGKSKEHQIDIVRKGNLVKLQLPDSVLPKIIPLIEPIIGEIEKEGPAYEAGLKPGDRILAINNDTVTTWYELVDVIHNSLGEKVKLTISRDNRTFNVFVIPEARKIMNGDSVEEVGMIGVALRTVYVKNGVIQSLKKAAQNTRYSAMLIFNFIGSLVKGKTSFDNVGGPVAIVQTTGQTMRWGIVSLLNFVALLSVNLFVINILPFPPSDGGYIVMFSLEKFLGKKRSMVAMKYFQQIGFVLIFALFIIVTFNDIIRIIWK